MPTAADFVSRYRAAADTNLSLLCVGLDPDPRRFPAIVHGSVYDFCKAIIDATAHLVCAYKLQIAYFSAVGAEADAVKIIDYLHTQYPFIPVILDAKRGDIGATAIQYANEAFVRYQADAVTVNPYMGYDTIAPFIRHEGRGVFVLCRTSNLSGHEFQDLKVDGQPLYEIVAQKAAQEWNTSGNVMLVVGATQPEILANVRSIVNDMPILVPGIGAQGGDLEAVINRGVTTNGGNLLINASRSVLYAANNNQFAEAAHDAAKTLRDDMNRYRYQSI